MPFVTRSKSEKDGGASFNAGAEMVKMLSNTFPLAEQEDIRDDILQEQDEADKK